MTKTERQQAASDELAARYRKCSFTGITTRYDCNDPHSRVYWNVSSWCFDCLCDELSGAKIAEQEDEQMSDKRETRRWLARRRLAQMQPYVEVLGERPGWDGDWFSGKYGGTHTTYQFPAEIYEAAHPDIRLEPGEGPIELSVEVKHD